MTNATVSVSFIKLLATPETELRVDVSSVIFFDTKLMNLIAICFMSLTVLQQEPLPVDGVASGRRVSILSLQDGLKVERWRLPIVMAR